MIERGIDGIPLKAQTIFRDAFFEPLTTIENMRSLLPECFGWDIIRWGLFDYWFLKPVLNLNPALITGFVAG